METTLAVASARATATIAPTDPAANMAMRLLWVDEVNGDEVWGLSPAPYDPLSI